MAPFAASRTRPTDPPGRIAFPITPVRPHDALEGRSIGRESAIRESQVVAHLRPKLEGSNPHRTGRSESAGNRFLTLRRHCSPVGSVGGTHAVDLGTARKSVPGLSRQALQAAAGMACSWFWMHNGCAHVARSHGRKGTRPASWAEPQTDPSDRRSRLWSAGWPPSSRQTWKPTPASWERMRRRPLRR